MPFCCNHCSFMDLYTFSTTSEREVGPSQLRSQKLGVRNLQVPSRNSMGSKHCALATNGDLHLYFAV